MARIRSDKPEAYQSETLAEISLAAERTFKGMATIADDRGRLADKPAQINGELWSMRGSHDKDDLEAELTEMVKAGLVCRYTACDGKRYIHLVKWDSHQKIDRPSKSRLPRCPVHLGEKDYCGLHEGPCPPSTRGVSTKEPSTFHEDSRVCHEDSMQDLGSRTVDLGSRTVEPRASVHELPPSAPVDAFELTDALRRWAHSTHPGLDLEFETEQFRRHYRSTGAERRSWPAAWQKWIADSHKRMTQPRASPRKDDNLAIVARFIDRHAGDDLNADDPPRKRNARRLRGGRLPAAEDERADARRMARHPRPPGLRRVPAGRPCRRQPPAVRSAQRDHRRDRGCPQCRAAALERLPGRRSPRLPRELVHVHLPPASRQGPRRAEATIPCA